MKAKQNLELINRDETVIISSQNCNDSVIVTLIDKTLHFRIFRNLDALGASVKALYLKDYPCNYRNIKFDGKLYVLAKEDINKTALFCINESIHGLEIKQVKRKQQNENLLNR